MTHTHTPLAEQPCRSQTTHVDFIRSMLLPSISTISTALSLSLSLSLHLSPTLSLSYNKQTNRKHEAGETRTTKQTESTRPEKHEQQNKQTLTTGTVKASMRDCDIVGMGPEAIWLHRYMVTSSLRQYFGWHLQPYLTAL